MMNNRLIGACRQLSPDQLSATATGTYGSIGSTLVHIANAQLGYASRLLDIDRPELLRDDAVPDLDVVAERARPRQRPARGGSRPGGQRSSGSGDR
jgi:uncharacterized damage-inducible protein DinB